MGKREIMARVKAALVDVRVSDPALDVPIPWEYGRPTAVANTVELFITRVTDYQASVVRAKTKAAVARCVAQALQQVGATSLVLPPGLDRAWVKEAAAAGVELRVDDPPLSHAELDATAAVITAAAVGMAETGTIALDHRADQGRRALSLVPDCHLCVIRANQIVSDVPEAMVWLEPSLREQWPVTWISGPSATSDIELSRVEGVHGPRTLYVIVVG